MEYKDTIFLPKTSFEMRANLPSKEPNILDDWNKQDIYSQLRKKSKRLFGPRDLADRLLRRRILQSIE